MKIDSQTARVAVRLHIVQMPPHRQPDRPIESVRGDPPGSSRFFGGIMILVGSDVRVIRLFIQNVFVFVVLYCCTNARLYNLC